MRSLGLDLGGTNIKLVVLEAGQVAERLEAPTRSEDGVDAVLERLVELGRAVGPVDSVGVALPGLFDEDGGAELLPNLHGAWTGRRLREPLEDGLGQTVRLVNDGHAFTPAGAKRVVEAREEPHRGESGFSIDH